MAHIPWMRENNPRIHRLSVSAVVALMLLMGAASAKEPSTGKKWTVPKLGMKFVWIPAMKCWVGKYEVSNREYRAFKPKHSTKDYKGIGLDGKRKPVEYINFDEAKAYAVWLTKRERDAGRLKPGLHYRLPTGKEWMTFAQCGDDREYPWGSSWPPTYGNYAGETSEKVLDPKVSFDWRYIKGYDDGFAVTCPVEKSGRNDWGLYGVGGNVWECTSNSAGGDFEAWRGASWRIHYEESLRSGFCVGRYQADPEYYRGGFRLILSPKELTPQ